MHRQHPRFEILVSITIFLLLLGCGDANPMPTFTTTGSVTYTDGQPIEEGSIIFVCEGMPSGRAVIENGVYRIGTFEEDDGAVAGKFRIAVTVNPPADYDPDSRRPAPKLAHMKYSAPDTSGLEFEVTCLLYTSPSPRDS